MIRISAVDGMSLLDGNLSYRPHLEFLGVERDGV
jgi:hypothetical protein